MYYSNEAIKEELLDNWESIQENAYPEDMVLEFADSAMPVYYSDIISDWMELDSEFTDSWQEQLGSEVGTRGITALMAIDVFNYYLDTYNRIYSELVAEKTA